MKKITVFFVVLGFLITCKSNSNEKHLITIEVEGLSIYVYDYDKIEKSIQIKLKANRDVLIPDNNKSLFFENAGYNELGWYVDIHLGWDMNKINEDYELNYRLLKDGDEFIEKINLSQYSIIKSVCIYYCYVLSKDDINKVLENKFHSTFYRYMRWGVICVDL